MPFLVDLAWAHLLHKPTEIVSRLRSLEDDARTLVDTLEQLPLDGEPARDLVAACDALRSFLEVPGRSALHLALRLSPADLAPERPARRRLERAWLVLAGQARRARERQGLLADCRAARAELEARFRPVLPWHLDAALGAAAHDPSGWDSASPRLLLATRRELQQAAAYLDTVRQSLPTGPAPALLEGAWPSEASPAELQMMRRMAASSQLRARAVRRRERLAAQARMHSPPEGQGPADRTSAQGLGVRPLSGTFVVLEPDAGTPYLTEPVPIRLNERVECRPWVVDAAWPSRSAETRLFEPCPVPIGGQVMVEQPAVVLPCARLEDGAWLGRVAEVGRLKVVTSGGRRRGNARTAPPVALPVRSRVSALAMTSSLKVRSVGEKPWTVLGITGEAVGAALDDAPVALLHTTAGNPKAQAALERELAFFQVARLRAPGLGVLPLGRDPGRGGAVYLLPAGVEPAHAPASQHLRATSPTVLAVAVARLWLRATQSRLGAGLYHTTTLGFRLPHHGRDPVEACLLMAPLGVPRLGTAYPRPAAMDQDLTHTHLGSPPLAGLAAAWATATPLTEARFAALLVLELLGDPAVPLPSLPTWESFLERLTQSRHRTVLDRRHPALVRDLVATLGASDDSLPAVLEWVARGRL